MKYSVVVSFVVDSRSRAGGYTAHQIAAFVQRALTKMQGVTEHLPAGVEFCSVPVVVTCEPFPEGGDAHGA